MSVGGASRGTDTAARYGLHEYVNTSIALQQLPALPGVPEPLAGRLTAAVRYTAVGDFTEAQRLLEPMRVVAEPALDTVVVHPYAAIGAVHANPAAAGPDSGSVQTIVEVRMLGERSPASHRITARSATATPPALWSTGGQMPNFAPSDDAGRAVRVYDEDTRYWLAALGDRHDPAGVFRWGSVVRFVA